VDGEIHPGDAGRVAREEVALDLPGEAEVVVEALAGEQALVEADEVERDAGLGGEAAEEVEVVLGEVPEGGLGLDVEDAGPSFSEGSGAPERAAASSKGSMGCDCDRSGWARSRTDWPWRSTRSTTDWGMLTPGTAESRAGPRRRRAASVLGCCVRVSTVTAAATDAWGNTSSRSPVTLSRSGRGSSVLAMVSEILYIAWSLRLWRSRSR